MADLGYDGKVAIITGAGGGLGRSHALELAKRGAAVTVLERPIRVSGTSTPSPYDAADVWLGQIQAPATFPAFNQVVYRRLFMSYELNYNPYTVAPVSEVGLFTNAANPLLPHNTMLAYDTFETIAKTDAVELEVAWTISF